MGLLNLLNHSAVILEIRSIKFEHIKRIIPKDLCIWLDQIHIINTNNWVHERHVYLQAMPTISFFSRNCYRIDHDILTNNIITCKDQTKSRIVWELHFERSLLVDMFCKIYSTVGEIINGKNAFCWLFGIEVT